MSRARASPTPDPSEVRIASKVKAGLAGEALPQESCRLLGLLCGNRMTDALEDLEHDVVASCLQLSFRATDADDGIVRSAATCSSNTGADE